MRNINLLFPTPLYSTKIPVKYEWLNCLKNLSYDRTTMDNGWVSSNKNLFKLDDLKDLYSKIQSEVEYFAYIQLGIVENITLDIVQSWSMKHKPKDWSQSHCHSNSIFSGIYYVEVYHDTGDLSFEKTPHYPNCFMSTLEPDLKGYNQFTTKVANIKPEVGDLFIFPSQLLHSVGKNISFRDRYCISFDVFIRGNIGEIVI